jgi:ABC-type phosphate transport system substrate-binding protein
VRRSDGSGTTFIFTDYLSKVSPSGSRKWARAPPCRGRKALAARATKGWPRTCSGSRAESATSSTRTPSATR